MDPAAEHREHEGEPREAQQDQRQAPGPALADPNRHEAVILSQRRGYGWAKQICSTLSNRLVASELW